MLSEKTFQKLFLLSPCVALYVACLPLNAFCASGDCGSKGLNILAVGWLGVFSLQPADYTWFANPVLVGSWCAFVAGERVASILCAAVALAIAGAFFFCDTVVVNESGTPSAISQFGDAYWLWLSSIGLTLLVSVFDGLLAKRSSGQ